MIGIIASKGMPSSKVTNNDIYFVHLNSSKEEDIEIEAKPYALALARAKNLKKVYLLYGEKGLIEYDFKV